VALVLGIACPGPWSDDLVRLSKAEGLAALQNQEYLHAWLMPNIFGAIQIIILIFAAFVSVSEPWGRLRKTKGEAETDLTGSA
jgi:hypothetical protein